MVNEQTYTTIHVSKGGHDIAPLTTAWAIPDDCPSPVQLINGGATLASSCNPPDYKNVWYSHGVYSPGICFSGYTSGCEHTNTNYGGPVKETETAVMCVPSGYSCDDSPLLATSVSGSSTISAPMFQIRWAESDLNALETHPLTPGTSDFATQTGSTVSETSAESTYTSDINGFPAAGVVGIIVGAAAAIAIVSVSSYFFIRGRRQKKLSAQVPAMHHQLVAGAPV
ncbi:hypothetical protein G7Z17_g7221 [Cylindrodendrum hubeiense]|uniref:Uncharacterized protein n=1 Tax=Cylindrodendrum hubeiense TaxID=595255 RepID=A0A9P5H5V7_9HYPO|nr:hypothetical protein G7Z17_g7221 [Cylindrodendrum hubeiense]